MFLIAKQYWVFPEYHLHPEGPQLISNFGFHPTINKIDAAMVWSQNIFRSERQQFVINYNFFRQKSANIFVLRRFISEI